MVFVILEQLLVLREEPFLAVGTARVMDTLENSQMTCRVCEGGSACI